MTAPKAPAGGQRFLEMPGVASVALASVLGGPVRPARVLGVFPTAVYLATDDLVVAVVTCDAVRLPNALWTSVASSERPFAHVGPGTPASVGRGSVTAGALAVRGVRWWDPRVRLGAVDLATVRRQAAAMRLLLGGAARQPGVALPPGLVDACLARDLPAFLAHAQALVGLGPGLTPSGDDLLGGMLAALSVLAGDDAFVRAAGGAVTALVTGRTTSISATLVRLAAAGQVSAEAAAVLRAVATGEALEGPVRTLLGVGHTSGADVAAGLLAGAVAAAGMAAGAARPDRAPVG